ncbi:MAG TPA: HAD family phosphatase [Verrucomicrobiae bacterium]|nr:HAD family phosphatase [Verrucomicrobiae bacterium]
MSQPDAVVFDLGKVLVDFDYSIAARRIAGRGTAEPDAVQGFLDHSPLLYRYETGHIGRQEFFEAVRRFSGFKGGIDEFAQFFADIFTEIPPMIALHRRLRDAQVPLYIFSNTNDLAIGHIRRNFPFFAEFHDFVLSYEHGAMKPDAKLYEVVERLTGRRGGQLLYLDDRIENVEAGRARGWRIIHHRQPAESIAVIEKLGLI